MADTNVSPEDRARHEKRERAEHLLFEVRFVVLVLFSLIYPFMVDAAARAVWWRLLLPVSVGYALVVGIAQRYRRHTVLATVLTTGGTAILILTWISATGGFDSSFYLAIHLAIIAAAFRLPTVQAWLATVFYSSGYLALLAMQGQLAPHATDSAIRVLFMFISAYLGMTMSREVLANTEAMVRIEAQRRVQERVAASERAAETLRTRFIEQVISAQDDERRHLSRELHDGIGQGLTAVILGLRRLEDAKSVESAHQQARELGGLTEHILRELGRTARGLHPSILDDLGFAPALERLAADFQRLNTIVVAVDVMAETRSLPQTTATTLYRIVQEALTNIAKHAQASAVSIVVERSPASVRLSVSDDGEGIADGKSRNLDGGLGLQGIRERVALLHGNLDIYSAPGGGTTLRVEIPAAVAE